MRKEIPLMITFIVGILMLFHRFIPPLAFLSDGVQVWFVVIAGFAMLLGLVSLLRVNWLKIERRARNWQYSIVLLVGLFGMIIAGFISRGQIEQGKTLFGWAFKYLQIPMSSTMFSLLAFFVASAAYRSFKARTPEATLLLASAFIVMLGRVSLGAYISESIPLFTEWIMNVPNMAGQRAIMIGSALGVISASLRIILGIERTYLGS